MSERKSKKPFTRKVQLPDLPDNLRNPTPRKKRLTSKQIDDRIEAAFGYCKVNSSDPNAWQELAFELLMKVFPGLDPSPYHRKERTAGPHDDLLEALHLEVERLKNERETRKRRKVTVREIVRDFAPELSSIVGGKAQPSSLEAYASEGKAIHNTRIFERHIKARARKARLSLIVSG